MDKEEAVEVFQETLENASFYMGAIELLSGHGRGPEGEKIKEAMQFVVEYCEEKV